MSAENNDEIIAALTAAAAADFGERVKIINAILSGDAAYALSALRDRAVEEGAPQTFLDRIDAVLAAWAPLWSDFAAMGD